MPAILITCPATGKPVDTGIYLDTLSFENPATIMEQNIVVCPHCGQQHTWDKKDAYPEGQQPK